jgi:hypothetical protein
MPLELISLGLSTLVGFVFKMIAMNQQAKQAQWDFLIKKGELNEKMVDSARKMQDPGAAFIRRFIVITMMSILAFIIIAPALEPGLTTNVISEIETEGFLGFGGGKQIVVTVVNGVVYDETIRSILASIMGFYFGRSV